MSMLDDLNDLQDKYDNLLRKYKKLNTLSRPSVVSVEEIEKLLDKYSVDSRDDYYDQTNSMAQAIYELYHPKARQKER